MKSEAWKRANAKWTKEKTKMVAFQLVASKDQDIIDFLATLPSKQAYLKELIREDIRRRTASQFRYEVYLSGVDEWLSTSGYDHAHDILKDAVENGDLDARIRVIEIATGKVVDTLYL